MEAVRGAHHLLASCFFVCCLSCLDRVCGAALACPAGGDDAGSCQSYLTQPAAAGGARRMPVLESPVEPLSGGDDGEDVAAMDVRLLQVRQGRLVAEQKQEPPKALLDSEWILGGQGQSCAEACSLKGFEGCVGAFMKKSRCDTAPSSSEQFWCPCLGTSGGNLSWFGNEDDRFPEVYEDSTDGHTTSCKLYDDGSDGCPLERLPHGQSAKVFPGGRSRCMTSDKPLFHFEVIRGDADKLLFFFQPGGACWDQKSFDMGVCSKGAYNSQPKGAFDRSNSGNPLRRYSIVHVLFCSGDVFAGDAWHGKGEPPEVYDKAGKPVEQRGYWNARLTLDWVKTNFPHMSSLVLAGSSAGSLGVQLWARTILTDLQGHYDDAAVVVDSFAGVSSTDAYHHLLKAWNTCATALIPDDMKDRCYNNQITVQDVFEQAMVEFPLVRFAEIMSKMDNVQILFYYLLVSPITTEEFFDGANVILARYSRHHNYATYLVDGGHHMYLAGSGWTGDVLFTADATGEYGFGVRSRPMLKDWLRDLVPPAPTKPLKTVCTGRYLDHRPCCGTQYCHKQVLRGTIETVHFAASAGDVVSLGVNETALHPSPGSFDVPLFGVTRGS